jgi:hypothetical protein
MGLEFLGATGLGAVGVFGAGAIGFAAGTAILGGCFSVTCSFFTAVGAGVGAAVGIALGAWGTGQLNDGNGGFGWVVLGELAGTSAGVGLLIANQLQSPAVVLLASVFPILGAATAYELSSDDSRRATERRRAHRSSARIAPSLAPVAIGQGASAGVIALF